METRNQIGVIRILAFCASSTTLAMTPEINFDPFNWIKLTIAIALTASASFIFFFSRKQEKKGKIDLLSFGTCTFLAMALLSFFINQNMSENFWGTPGRATGLAYTVLISLIFLIGAKLDLFLSREIIFRSLRITGDIFICYVTLQFLDLDPVNWTVNQTFGFMGNLNFSSAFLGMYAVAELRGFLNIPSSQKTRISSGTRILLSTFYIWDSGSLQGILMFSLAMSLILILRHGKQLWKKPKFTYLATFSVFLFCTGTILLMAQKSFLNGIIFQETLGYRLDYWKAGLKMWTHSLFIGIGSGEFGSYYREYRAASSIFPDVDRTSNSAHSIIVEILAGQGLFVGTIYLSAVILVAIAGLRFTIRSNNDYVFVTYALWLALQIQLVIGIGQVSLGVWNSIFAGMLVSGIMRPERLTPGLRARKSHGSQNDQLGLSTRSILRETSMTNSSHFLGSLGLIFGLLVASPMLISDAQYQTFQKQSDFSRMESIANRPFVSIYYKERTLERYVQQSDYENSNRLAIEIAREYPRSFYAWKVLALMPEGGEGTRNEAKARLRTLDPHNQSWNE